MEGLLLVELELALAVYNVSLACSNRIACTETI